MAKQATPMIVILQRCFVHGAGKLGTRPSVDTVNGIMVDLICGAFARLAVRAMILAKVEFGNVKRVRCTIRWARNSRWSHKHPAATLSSLYLLRIP